MASVDLPGSIVETRAEGEPQKQSEPHSHRTAIAIVVAMLVLFIFVYAVRTGALKWNIPLLSPTASTATQ